MDVFLVPCGPDRYTPYCEKALDPEPELAQTTPGWWQRQLRRFRDAVEAAEADDGDTPGSADAASGARGGVGRWIMRRIAEAVAEQRLLWTLRQETTAVLHHPDDVPPDRALTLLREELAADYGKHRRWCVIDALLVALFGPLFFFVPGPNLVSWYFAFRAVGHWLALRGARQGLDRVAWTAAASADLRDIRRALELPADERRDVVERVSGALGLSRLTRFVDRVSARPR